MSMTYLILGRIAYNMKTITLVFLCLTLNTAVGRAEDYHLKQTQICDRVAPGVKLANLTVYVFLYPDQRVFVFKTFDSKPMEEAIKDLPHGSVLHYDGNPLMKGPPGAKIAAIEAFCKTKGISFIVSPTS